MLQENVLKEKEKEKIKIMDFIKIIGGIYASFLALGYFQERM
jgi:hypothetical protein